MCLRGRRSSREPDEGEGRVPSPFACGRTNCETFVKPRFRLIPALRYPRRVGSTVAVSRRARHWRRARGAASLPQQTSQASNVLAAYYQMPSPLSPTTSEPAGGTRSYRMQPISVKHHFAVLLLRATGEPPSSWLNRFGDWFAAAAGKPGLVHFTMGIRGASKPGNANAASPR
jgi:hypothetical protein